MAKQLQAVRGMNDILPEQIVVWQFIESQIRRLTEQYGYQEIRTPLVESVDLFKRSIGDVTDIVEKEMYVFEDRNGDLLALRPEGTASTVRAGIEHGLLYNQIQRLWYQGPMFRHERPQRGRYRQFYQVGIETFGMPGPDIDAELFILTAQLWRALGIDSHVNLQINSLGTPESRQHYRAVLTHYFKANSDRLDEDSLRRLEKNPLRILDSKNPAMADLIANAPSILDHLDEESAHHFAALQRILKAADIRFTINPRLVRGLDYYTRTVFEWVTESLGAQGTVCAGGRYDGLVEQLGGKPTPAFGLAMGVDRLVEVMLLQQPLSQFQQPPHVYLIVNGEIAREQGVVIAQRICQQIPRIKLITDCSGGGIKTQFKRADKSQADIALVLADDEMTNQQVTIKFLRDERPQQTVALSELTAWLNNEIME